MTQGNDDMSALDSHFAAARNTAPTPSSDLLARVLSDAEAVQAGQVQTRMASTPRGTPLAQLFRALGGWPAMGGLTTAAVAGLWIGISPPAALQEMTDGYLGPDTTVYLIDTSADVALGLIEEAS